MPAGSREAVSSRSPYPFGTKPIPHVGWFHLTTMLTCVRVPPCAPWCSAGCAGGFSVTAFHARFIALRVKSPPWGMCITLASRGEALPLYRPQVITDLAVSTLHP
jgi:hypothetical protein